MKIRNNVIGCKTIAWSELKGYEFNDLKASGRKVRELKNSIIHNGFNFPFFIWAGHKFVIDGKGRDLALQELERDGHEICDLPIIEIYASSKREAKALVLQASSDYGKVTNESFGLFVMDMDLKESEYKLFSFDIEDIKWNAEDDFDLLKSEKFYREDSVSNNDEDIINSDDSDIFNENSFNVSGGGEENKPMEGWEENKPMENKPMERKIPLAIFLSNQEYRKWVEFKEENGYRNDLEAFKGVFICQ